MKNKKSIYDYIGISCYKYAPESFKAYFVLSFSHGNRNIPEYTQINLTYDETSICGNAFCCKGKKEAITELKKIIRKHIKNSRQYMSIGFMLKDSTQYIYTQQLKANKNNLQDQLSIFKEFKQYNIEHDCKYNDYSSATLNGNYKPENIENHYSIIDISKPIIINYKQDKNYVLA